MRGKFQCEPTWHFVSSLRYLQSTPGLLDQSLSNFHIMYMFMARMRSQVESCANFNRYQSAYMRGHSTETTLLRVLDDVYHAADDHSRSLLLQLDLSAAFDTLGKPTLLCRLDHAFGVRGTSHKWVDSYLNGRSQYVRQSRWWRIGVSQLSLRSSSR